MSLATDATSTPDSNSSPESTQIPMTESGTLQTKQWSAIGFHSLAIAFNICLNIQVLTVGLAYFYNPQWWQAHVWLVRGYSGLSLILLVWVHLIPFPKRVQSLTTSMPVLLGLQFLTIHWKTSIPLAVVHPLIGFALFSVSTTLVHRVNRFLFPKAEDEYSQTL